MAKDCPYEAECFKKFDMLFEKIDDLKDNLFVKKDSLMSQVLRNTVFRKFSCWIFGVSTIAFLGLLVKLLYSHFTEK